MRSLTRALSILTATVLLGAVLVPEVAAQGGQAASGSGLGRPYWHVFIAYALAWVLVLGWVVSIARRLARIEERLDD